MTIKKGIRKVWFPAFASAVWVLLALSAFAQAPDPTGIGPLATTSAEYKFDPTLDLDVSGMATELWARVYRPVDLSGGPFPLLIFLHGNHATCGRIAPSPPFPPGLRIDDNTQYTFYGTCPPTRPIVTPNHLGYAYVAERLASWGYIIVSINANRGVNAAPGTSDDLGVNLVRGRLLLRHLQRLSEWNTFGGTPESLGADLLGKLDFNNVGLFGHSRGGEGVRAAYNQYRDPGSPWPERIPDPIAFRGIFEIGPVDGQTERQLEADDTVWNVLLPMCDGDVSNLQGIKPFDRMLANRNDANTPAQKSTFTVWGANHNFYNTEWQLSDSDGCFGHAALFGDFFGSPQQRQTGLVGAMAFFRGNVGNANRAFNQNFNPQFAPTTVLTSVTRVDRGFTDSPSPDITTVFDDFPATGGNERLTSNITLTFGTVPNHDAGDPYGRPGQQRAAAISWTASGANTFLQSNWSAAGTGRDISSQRTLDLRLARQCVAVAGRACQQASPLNPAGPTNFSIRLALADGTLSDPVLLTDYTDLRGPVGGGFTSNPFHPILQTARIPLEDFGNADLTQVRGVRLTFDGTTTGAIFVANIRLSNISGSGEAGGAGDSSGDSEQPATSGGLVKNENITEGNLITVRSVASANALADQPGYEIEVTSGREFPVRDELAVLRIGAQSFALSRYPDTGDTHTLIFTLTPEQFANTVATDEVTLQYGFGEPNVRWSFGPLNKAALNR